MKYNSLRNRLKQLLTVFKWIMSLIAFRHSFTRLLVMPFLIIFSQLLFSIKNERLFKIVIPVLVAAFNSNLLLTFGNAQSVAKFSQSSSYRLIGSSSSYAQYLPWYPCLNGSLVFEFKTHEPNGLLFYTQSLPYKYIQLSLADGNLRMRMRISEKDNPRGVFLIYQKTKLNDEKWHEVRITRMNERTILTIDNDESLFHVHKEASLEGNDLHFGDLSNLPNNENGYLNNNNNLLVFGGLPNELQTFDLSLGTALFEHRYNGFIRNARVSNCSLDFVKLNVITSNNLRFITETDSCQSNPCLNKGVCLIMSDLVDNYKCDCSSTNYDGKNCEKCKLFKLNTFQSIISIRYIRFGTILNWNRLQEINLISIQILNRFEKNSFEAIRSFEFEKI